MIGVQTIALGVKALSCCTPFGIIAAAVGAACVAFATAEAQEGLGYGNWMKDAGLSDGWYTGLMTAANAAAIAANLIGPKCFKEGTLIETEEGLKPIDKVVVGESVLAYDEATGKQEYKKVVKLFRNKTLEWCHVSIDGMDEPIISTPGHKYYLPENIVCQEVGERHEHAGYDELSIKWVSACNLKNGDKVLLSDGKYGIVVSVKTEKLDEPIAVYNFEVDASKRTGRPENETDMFMDGRNQLTANDESKEKAGGWAYRKVTRVFRNTTYEWVHVNINGEDITCTGEHPFYILNATADTPIVRFEGRDDSNSERQWVAAKNLKAGHICVLSNGGATIDKIIVEHLDEPETTYNLEIEGAHTFCVGRDGVLVHNACKYFEATRTDDGIIKGREITKKQALNRIRGGNDVLTNSRSSAKALVKDAFGNAKAYSEIHLNINKAMNHFHDALHHIYHVFY